MYLSATNESLKIITGVTASISESQFVVSYQDITSIGMTLPMLSNQGATSGSNAITMVSAPASSTTRQITEFHISNIDTNNHTVTVYKDVGGTDYTIIKLTLIPGQTLYYSRDAGFQVTTGDPNSNIAYQIESFTANGTYNKKPNASFVFVSCVGAGGGGGSGRRGAAGTNRFGGGGGGGGAVVWRLLQNSVLSNTTSITIGAGGPGAPGQISDDFNGTQGTSGGNTSFGSHITAAGGSPGNGGTTAAAAGGAGGSISVSTPSFGPYTVSGGPSNNSQTTNAVSITSGLNNTGAPGGCSGGGISNTNISSVANYQGAGVYNNGALISGPSTNNNGANNQATSLLFSDVIFGLEGLGTGGSGGRPGLENAGNGGLYGAGGGGGSGVLNGTTSGAGGNGGGGLCIVLTIY